MSNIDGDAMVDESKTLMGTDYVMRVDFTIDDWTWLCHILRDVLNQPSHCPECENDISEVLGVIEAADAVKV